MNGRKGEPRLPFFLLVKPARDELAEDVTYRSLNLHADREQSWRIAMDHLLQLHRASLLGPWALLGLATMAEPSDKQMDERMSVCERAIRFSPARVLIARCAIQMELAGKHEEADRLLQGALRAFPAEREQTILELKRWSAEFPTLRTRRSISRLTAT